MAEEIRSGEFLPVLKGFYLLIAPWSEIVTLSMLNSQWATRLFHPLGRGREADMVSMSHVCRLYTYHKHVCRV